MSIADTEPDAVADPNEMFGKTGSNYTNEDKDYGVTWMYIPDGNGVPQVAYLTEEAEASRGRRKNVKEHVRFELYTKWVFSTILNLWHNFFDLTPLSHAKYIYICICMCIVRLNVSIEKDPLTKRNVAKRNAGPKKKKKKNL